MVAPLSLIVSAFAPVRDVRRTLTPQLRTDRGDTSLVLIDSAAAATGSAARASRRCTAARQRSARRRRSGAARRLLRGDRQSCNARRAGCSRITIAPTAGLFVTACEMAFAGALRRRRRARPQTPTSSRRRCSTKSSAPCCRFAAPTAHAVRRRSSVTASRASRSVIGRVDERGPRASIRAGGKVVLDASRVDAAARLVGDELPHAASCATTRSARARSSTALLDAERSGPERRS